MSTLIISRVAAVGGPAVEPVQPEHAAALAELLAAVREDDLAATRAALAAGAPARGRNAHGQCPVACAALHASAEVLAALLDAGGHPDAIGVDDQPALILAAGRDAPEVVRTLCAAGAQLGRPRPVTLETALHVAASCGRTATAAALVAAGAALEAHAAIETISDLLPCGRETQGETPLHRAAERAPEALVRLLLDAGADRAARTVLGETPQSWARRGRRSPELVRLLRP